jgi:hypothetical protein
VATLERQSVAGGGFGAPLPAEVAKTLTEEQAAQLGQLRTEADMLYKDG